MNLRVQHLAVVHMDPRGLVVAASDAVSKLTDLPPHELVGKAENVTGDSRSGSR